jgi:hypothetical protein
MPRVGFEPTVPVLVRAKTVHTLDHAATVIGTMYTLRRTNYKLTLSRLNFSHVWSHTLSSLEPELNDV